MQRVYIRNIPSTVTLEELERLCRALGVDGDVSFARDSASGRFAGDAYVTARTLEEAEEAAAKLHGQLLGAARIEATRVGGDAFFDQDGLFADGAAPMGRRDGRGPKRD